MGERSIDCPLTRFSYLDAGTCIASSRVEHYTSDIGILVRLQCDANNKRIGL